MSTSRPARRARPSPCSGGATRPCGSCAPPALIAARDNAVIMSALICDALNGLWPASEHAPAGADPVPRRELSAGSDGLRVAVAAAAA